MAGMTDRFFNRDAAHRLKRRFMPEKVPTTGLSEKEIMPITANQFFRHGNILLVLTFLLAPATSIIDSVYPPLN